jgi:hypothetical protein
MLALSVVAEHADEAALGKLGVRELFPGYEDELATVCVGRSATTP